MLSELDNFYEQKDEPNRSCFLALRDIILNYDTRIVEAYKYKLPCFVIGKTIVCYLWKDKKTETPYISFNKGVKINHPDLYQGNRKTFKLLYIDPLKDIPIGTINNIFEQAIKLY